MSNDFFTFLVQEKRAGRTDSNWCRKHWSELKKLEKSGFVSLGLDPNPESGSAGLKVSFTQEGRNLIKKSEEKPEHPLARAICELLTPM